MSITEKAKLFAIKAHGDQKYGDHPYSYHLQCVVDILLDSVPDPEPEYILAAGYLHDTIEDTDVTFEQVFEEFGREIARIVFACTDEPGKNRAIRHMYTYPKLKAAGRSAIAVKLADRIANVEHSLKHNHSMFLMYKKEYAEFRKMLHLPGELKKMWARLDILMDRSIEE